MSNAFDLDQGASEPDGNIFKSTADWLSAPDHQGRFRRTSRRSDLELRKHHGQRLYGRWRT